MGCSQNKKTLILGLKDEIKKLQDLKWKILKEKDKIENDRKFYSQSDEDLDFQNKKLTSSYTNLEKEYARLLELREQESSISKRVSGLEIEKTKNESEFNDLKQEPSQKQQQLLKISDEINSIL